MDQNGVRTSIGSVNLVYLQKYNPIRGGRSNIVYFRICVLCWKFLRLGLPEQIPFFLLADTTAQHVSTQNSIAKDLFGRQLMLPIDLEFGSPLQQDEEVQEDYARIPQAIYDFGHTKICKNRNRIKARYGLSSVTNTQLRACSAL